MPVIQINQNPMALVNLPGHNEHSTPKFEGDQPEELVRYFEDLQMLLDHYQIIADTDCKLAVVKYLKIRTEELWKTTSTWLDQMKTYDKFKTEVFGLYPGMTGDRTYTIQDLDLV